MLIPKSMDDRPLAEQQGPHSRIRCELESEADGSHRIIQPVDIELEFTFGHRADHDVLDATAERIDQKCREICFFSHRSAEQAHGEALEALKVEPLLDLKMRLGEGTGAALAMPILEAAAKLLCEMATFDSAGVSGVIDGASPP